MSLLSVSLGEHPFMGRLLRALAGREKRSGARHWREIASGIAGEDEDFKELTEERQWLLISSFVSLIAHARVVESAGRLEPFLQVQVQLWVREVHGLLRLVTSDGYRLAWQDDLKAPDDEKWLPMVYCQGSLPFLPSGRRYWFFGFARGYSFERGCV